MRKMALLLGVIVLLCCFTPVLARESSETVSGKIEICDDIKDSIISENGYSGLKILLNIPIKKEITGTGLVITEYSTIQETVTDDEGFFKFDGLFSEFIITVDKSSA